jgi:hypothetical protein
VNAPASVSSRARVVARIMGGLGNQLFCYAAARRLALVSGAELVIDDETGFTRDHVYRREYALDAFRIAGRKATAAEKLEPFERLRRPLLRRLHARLPFARRTYLAQEGLDFEPRLLALRPRRTLWLDGYWQSEGYFGDVAETIRADLAMDAPADARNQATARAIDQCNAVALHVRWFDDPAVAGGMNVTPDYYRRAVALAEARLDRPHFFVFSDKPEAARAGLDLPRERTTFVTHNDTAAGALADFWLMRRCRHFIIANSTFSWWAAWLGESSDKCIIAPSTTTVRVPSWTFVGLLPETWVKV